jgi:hypothetical protein
MNSVNVCVLGTRLVPHAHQLPEHSYRPYDRSGSNVFFSTHVEIRPFKNVQ